MYRTQLLIVHRGGVLCTLLIAKLCPMQIQALIKCEFRISGHNQKSEDFETIQEKLFLR